MTRRIRHANPLRAPGARSDDVYRGVLELVRSGAVPLHARLPTELELARRFAVSRPVVRQALTRLREDGVIRTRQGSGSVVVRRPDAALAGAGSLESIADIQRCYEFRAALEGEIAALAARRRSEADLRRMRRALADMQRAERRGAPAVAEDLEFHLAIARAVDNPLFEQALLAVRDRMLFGMGLVRELSTRRRAAHMRQLLLEHRRLLGAVARGDAAGARRAARTHVERARRRMFEGR